MQAEIITTGAEGQPITAFAQVEVAGVIVRASNGWKTPGIRIRASHKDLITPDQIPALIEVLEGIMAQAPKAEPKPEPKAPPTAAAAEASSEISDLRQMMLQMAGTVQALAEKVDAMS